MTTGKFFLDIWKSQCVKNHLTKHALKFMYVHKHTLVLAFSFKKGFENHFGHEVDFFMYCVI